MQTDINTAQGTASQHGYAFMADMTAYGAKILTELTDTPLESAEQVTHHLVEELRKHWGGSQLYIPKTSLYQLHQRDLAIYNDFTGRNHHELARKYDLSEITVYQILKRVRESLPKKQGDLFIEPPQNTPN